MTEIEQQMVLRLIVWGCAVLLVLWSFFRRRSPASSGLVIAYLLMFSGMHCVAGVCRVLNYGIDSQSAIAEEGFRESSLGAIAFAVASALYVGIQQISMRRRFRRLKDQVARLRVQGQHTSREGKGEPTWIEIDHLGRAATKFVLVGCFIYASVEYLPVLPSITAILAAVGYLLVTGVCLGCWQGWILRSGPIMFRWLAIAFCLPFAILVFKGFLGFGIAMLLMVLAFVGAFYQPRRVVLGSALVFFYLLVSLFVNYMDKRQSIRTSVWGEGAVVDRMVATSAILTEFELFDPTKREHALLVLDRLDQNLLIGRAIKSIETTGNFASGETIAQSLVTLIPRVMWPDKPIQAGSGSMVSRYTGIEFSEGTSVGMGQVFEFYVNFGTMGVVVGFFVLGLILTALDLAAARALRLANWPRFVVFFLPGIGMVQPEGSLVDIVPSMVAALVVAWIAGWSIARVQPRSHTLTAKVGRAEMST